jgi:hypothetical protein
MTDVGQGPRINSADGVSGSHLIAAYWYAARLTQGANCCHLPKAQTLSGTALVRIVAGFPPGCTTHLC